MAGVLGDDQLELAVHDEWGKIAADNATSLRRFDTLTKPIVMSARRFPLPIGWVLVITGLVVHVAT
jgi:hypothetical protein